MGGMIAIQVFLLHSTTLLSMYILKVLRQNERAPWTRFFKLRNKQGKEAHLQRAMLQNKLLQPRFDIGSGKDQPRYLS